jgi:hypothetical protein
MRQEVDSIVINQYNGRMKERVSTIPVVLEDDESTASPPTPSELARLESMTREELIALAKRMACQCGLVAVMTEEEREQALFDVLALKGIKAMDVPAIREYFDRTKGKPAQSINQQVLQASLTFPQSIEIIHVTPHHQ